MSKYILTLLVCLSSHTMAATNHTQTAPSLTTEKNVSSSEALHKKPSTIQKGYNLPFWKAFFGYFGFTSLMFIIGLVTIVYSVAHLNFSINHIFILSELKDTGLFGMLTLFIDAVSAFIAAFFYTKFNKSCKRSLSKLSKLALGFFPFCIVGTLAAIVVAYYIEEKSPILTVLVPFVIIFVSSIIGALINVRHFNKLHQKKEEKQVIKGAQ